MAWNQIGKQRVCARKISCDFLLIDRKYIIILLAICTINIVTHRKYYIERTTLMEALATLCMGHCFRHLQGHIHYYMQCNMHAYTCVLGMPMGHNHMLKIMHCSSLWVLSRHLPSNMTLFSGYLQR